MHQRAALAAGEDRARDLRADRLGRQNHATARAAQRLVSGHRQGVGVADR